MLEEREISLKELFEAIWSRKFFISALAILGLILAFLGATIYDNNTSTVETYVNINWTGLSQGEYPNGEQFNYTDLAASTILLEAIELSGYDLDVSDVQQNLNITPVVPTSVFTMIQQKLEEGEQVSYYATDYNLSLNNAALNLSVEEGSVLITNVVTAFKTNYEDRYINNTAIINYVEQDLTDVEYVDIGMLLQNQIDLINTVMDARIDLDAEYVSPTSGLSFNDIIAQTSIVEILSVNPIESRTSMYLLTKDLDYVVTLYEYRIEQMQVELNKELSNKEDLLSLLDNYTGSTTTILVPGTDATNAIEIDPYYNTLMSTIVSTDANINELEEDIAWYEQLISRYQNEDPTFSVSENDKLAAQAKVDELINEALIDLNTIIDDANDLMIEHNIYLSSNVISLSVAPQYVSEVSRLLYSAIGLILGSGVGLAIVLFKHDWKQEEKA